MTQTVHVPLYTIRHGQIGGTEFAIYNLMRGLAEAGPRVTLAYGRDTDLSPDFLRWAQRHDRVSLDRQGGLPGPKAMRFAEETLFQQRDRNAEWAIFPNYFCPPALKRNNGKNCVVLHDIQYKRYPQYHSAKRRAWLDFYLPRMFARADSVIVISQSELALVRQYFGDAAAARCDVVHNAIDFTRLEGGFPPDAGPRAALVPAQRYILSVCHNFPHKNISTLLDAFARIAQRDPALHLYLVGSVSEANYAFVRAALPETVRDRVHLTGFISDADLGRLYANAEIFVLPSLYEGFGMPAVEALGMGVPTIVSNAYALPEVTLGYAGMIDDPLDARAWADAIEATIVSGIRPTAEQVSHVRATYHPVTIAKTLLCALHSRESGG